MFKLLRKYKLHFDILATLVFALGSFFNFYQYFTLEYENSTKKGMDLFGGITMGIMATFYMAYVIERLRKK